MAKFGSALPSQDNEEERGNWLSGLDDSASEPGRLAPQRYSREAIESAAVLAVREDIHI